MLLWSIFEFVAGENAAFGKRRRFSTATEQWWEMSATRQLWVQTCFRSKAANVFRF